MGSRAWGLGCRVLGVPEREGESRSVEVRDLFGGGGRVQFYYAGEPTCLVSPAFCKISLEIGTN